MSRALTDEDFEARHKFSFDMYVQHALLFSFGEFLPTIDIVSEMNFLNAHFIKNIVQATSSLHRRNMTSNSKTTRHGSSVNSEKNTSTSIQPTTFYP